MRVVSFHSLHALPTENTPSPTIASSKENKYTARTLFSGNVGSISANVAAVAVSCDAAPYPPPGPGDGPGAGPGDGEGATTLIENAMPSLSQCAKTVQPNHTVVPMATPVVSYVCDPEPAVATRV